jgi:hypothetical protein
MRPSMLVTMARSLASNGAARVVMIYASAIPELTDHIMLVTPYPAEHSDTVLHWICHRRMVPSMEAEATCHQARSPARLCSMSSEPLYLGTRICIPDLEAAVI